MHFWISFFSLFPNPSLFFTNTQPKTLDLSLKVPKIFIQKRRTKKRDDGGDYLRLSRRRKKKIRWKTSSPLDPVRIQRCCCAFWTLLFRFLRNWLLWCEPVRYCCCELGFVMLVWIRVVVIWFCDVFSLLKFFYSYCVHIAYEHSWVFLVIWYFLWCLILNFGKRKGESVWNLRLLPLLSSWSVWKKNDSLFIGCHL